MKQIVTTWNKVFWLSYVLIRTSSSKVGFGVGCVITWYLAGVAYSGMTSRRGPEIPSILVVVSVHTGIGDALVHGDRREVFSNGRSVCFFEDDFCFCIFFRLGDCMNRQKWAACIVLFFSSVRLYLFNHHLYFSKLFWKRSRNLSLLLPFHFFLEVF